jgi:TPP-dependent pyruvate/acetoin dehydrogenase alpha subunit
MGTPQSIVMNIKDVADRAVAYGIKGVVVDGNRVLDVYRTASEAVERAKAGGEPTLIECKTYRRKGHSRVDPAKYRPKEEVEGWLRKDPITQFREQLLREYSFDNKDLDGLEKEAWSRVEDAAKYALESPYPKPEEALEDVYT